MTLAQRDRLRSILTVVLLLTVGLTLLLRLRLAPMAEQLIVTQVDNQASDAINAAIDEQITSGEIDYDRMISVEKDAKGNVNALHTNIAEINRLKTSILKRVDEKLENLSMEELSVPIGSVLLPELLSGRGPKIPVRVLAVRTSDAVFRSSFESAGINQTKHSIMIDIHVVITILTWAGTQEIAVDSSVVAAETVIVGTVPTTYFGMEELP
ncbi:MAG: sporulation protein YunB [Firmicutes bacterium]|nr:sporulation protein YunB [Bacillota bacterium]